ncbi:hypothetical protein BDZ97DRAFT_1764702 [Flammula alnicola]|nr:hypothetical protein BDZ97DRAFT_1764702 [Flammula alnicola]
MSRVDRRPTDIDSHREYEENRSSVHLKPGYKSAHVHAPLWWSTGTVLLLAVCINGASGSEPVAQRAAMKNAGITRTWVWDSDDSVKPPDQQATQRKIWNNTAGIDMGKSWLLTNPDGALGGKFGTHSARTHRGDAVVIPVLVDIWDSQESFLTFGAGMGKTGKASGNGIGTASHFPH